MFHCKFSLPDPFHQIELFGLVEPVATDFGKTALVSSLYLVAPYAEGGRLLLRRSALTVPPKPHRICPGERGEGSF